MATDVFRSMCVWCMCVLLGTANKGFWGELLGVGDFYYELAVQVVDVCMATRYLPLLSARWLGLRRRGVGSDGTFDGPHTRAHAQSLRVCMCPLAGKPTEG